MLQLALIMQRRKVFTMRKSWKITRLARFKIQRESLGVTVRLLVEICVNSLLIIKNVAGLPRAIRWVAG